VGSQNVGGVVTTISYSFIRENLQARLIAAESNAWVNRISALVL
jgi:hypothetical protein